VPGHEDIVGNEMADQLARTGSEHLFTGPEPACGISTGVAKKAVRDWMNRNHKKTLGKVAVQGPDLLAHPSYIHTNIHIYLTI
jgi:hypothetical protein